MHVHTSPPPGGAPAPGTVTDLGLQSDRELLGGAHADEVERRRCEGVLIRRMIEIERRRLHLDDGFRDLAAWGRGVHRWSDVEARARRNLAALAVECPQVLQFLLEGRLGVAQAHLVGRLFRAPRVGRFVPLFMEQILDAASSFDFADFELFVKEWKLRVDTDGPDPARAHAERQASLGFGDHEFHFVVTGPNVDGAALKALLDRFERIEFDLDWAACVAEHGDEARPDLMRRSAQARRYDAWSNLLAHVRLPADTTDPNDLEPDADDGPAGDGPAGDGAVTTSVDIVIDLRSWVQGLDEVLGGARQGRLTPPFGPDRAFSHTLDGVLISARDAALASLRGKVRLVVVGDDGLPVQMTSASRLFTGRMRDAILHLATRCTHPGCNHPATACEIDHLQPWCEGGTTCVGNGAPACRHHNNWRFRTGARTLRRANGSWATRRRDGTEVAPPG